MSLGLYWTYWRQLDSRMGRVRGCGLLYGAAMERERWRGWETAAFVLRSLERLGRNESGSSVQDSLMLCATNDTVYLFVPEDRSTPPTAFYGRPPGKCLFPSLFECVMLSNEKEPATLDLLVFNRYPIRKKKVEVSRGKRDSANRFAFSSSFLLKLLLFNYETHFYYISDVYYFALLNVIKYRVPMRDGSLIQSTCANWEATVLHLDTGNFGGKVWPTLRLKI